MSQLFLTNYSIIIIKHSHKVNEEEAVYCLGNESIISNPHATQEVKYSSPKIIAKRKPKINFSTSRLTSTTKK